MNAIDFNSSKQCTLILRVGTGGIAAGVFNPLTAEKGDALQVEHLAVNTSFPLAANLKRIFDEQEWLSCPFCRVYVLVATCRFTWMPLELFDEKLVKAVFAQNLVPQPNEEVMHQVLRSNNAVVLFGMDKSVYEVIKRVQPDACICAQVSPLAETFSVQSRLGNTRKIFAHLCSDYVDVFCYDHGRLLLANSYHCHLTPDRIYYLLYLWQTLGFDQERDELHLCGVLDDKEALLSGLREFLRQVFVMHQPADADLRAVLSWKE